MTKAADLAALASYLTVDTSGNVTASAAMNAASFNSTSTARLKKNIKKLSKEAIEKFDDLMPREFDWRRQSSTPGKHDIGFIAEEVNLLYPEFVAKDISGECLGIDYAKLTTVLTAKVQELEKRVKQLEP